MKPIIPYPNPGFCRSASRKDIVRRRIFSQKTLDMAVILVSCAGLISAAVFLLTLF